MDACQRERQGERISIVWGNLCRKYFCIDIKEIGESTLRTAENMAVSLPAAFPFTEIKITALSSTDYLAAWTWTRRQPRAMKHCLQSAPFPYRTCHVQMNQIRTRCDFTEKQSLRYHITLLSIVPRACLKSRRRTVDYEAESLRPQSKLPYLSCIILYIHLTIMPAIKALSCCIIMCFYV